MPTKEDLLWDLKVKELRKLAKENRVSLVKEGWFGSSRAYQRVKKELKELRIPPLESEVVFSL